jgi:hypothetical protein
LWSFLSLCNAITENLSSISFVHMISVSLPTDRNPTWSTVRGIYRITARTNGAVMPVEPIHLTRHSDGRNWEKHEEQLISKAKTVYTWNSVLCHLKKTRVLRLGGLLSLYKVLPNLNFAPSSVLFLSRRIHRPNYFRFIA